MSSLDSRNDSTNGHKYAKNGLVANRPARGHPAQRDDGARLDVADDGAGNGTSLCDDEELRDVDERRKAAGLGTPSQ